MAIYTLTNNLIENITSSDISLFGSLFYVFANEKSGHKLAIDSNKKLLGLYTEAIIDPNMEQYYKAWLDLFSRMLNSICEFIPVDIDPFDKDNAFLKIASSINGRKNLIVYSRNINCPYCCNDNNETEYNCKKIHVLDKDETISEINTKNNGDITIQQTIGNNSPLITGNQNKVKNKL